MLKAGSTPAAKPVISKPRALILFHFVFQAHSCQVLASSCILKKKELTINFKTFPSSSRIIYNVTVTEHRIT